MGHPTTHVPDARASGTATAECSDPVGTAAGDYRVYRPSTPLLKTCPLAAPWATAAALKAHRDGRTPHAAEGVAPSGGDRRDASSPGSGSGRARPGGAAWGCGSAHPWRGCRRTASAPTAINPRARSPNTIGASTLRPAVWPPSPDVARHRDESALVDDLASHADLLTPGIVMSQSALYRQPARATRAPAPCTNHGVDEPEKMCVGPERTAMSSDIGHGAWH